MISPLVLTGRLLIRACEGNVHDLPFTVPYSATKLFALYCSSLPNRQWRMKPREEPRSLPWQLFVEPFQLRLSLLCGDTSPPFSR